jgi:hypothetical protein
MRDGKKVSANRSMNFERLMTNNDKYMERLAPGMRKLQKMQRKCRRFQQ